MGCCIPADVVVYKEAQEENRGDAQTNRYLEHSAYGPRNSERRKLLYINRNGGHVDA